MCIPRAVVAVLLALGTGCTERVQEPVAADEEAAAHEAVVQRQASDTKVLRCTIRTKPTCELGKAPKVTVAIRNQTNTDIYLVGSLDASDCKWRYPHCYFEVTGPDGQSAVQRIARCGNMNTLREKDFVKLPPSCAFDPYQRIDNSGFFAAHQLAPSTFRTAGEYRIRFVYSTKGEAIGKWVGDGLNQAAANEKLIGLLKQVPKVEVWSDEIKVTVVEPRK
jgi:hypothetical protein